MKKHWSGNFKRKSKEERTSNDGIVHSSESQLRRWNQLRMLVQAGQIRNLRREVAYQLIIPTDPPRPVFTAGGRQIMKYIADYVYESLNAGEWVEVIEEHKGFMAEDAQIKIRVFEAIYDKKVTIHTEGKKKSLPPEVFEKQVKLL